MSTSLTTALSISIGHAPEKSDLTRIEFSDHQFAEHVAIYGGTGKGKSKLIELMFRDIISHHRGACLIDPHGDLAEDLLGFVMSLNGLDPLTLARIHYFEPGSPTNRFSFDPFRYVPLPGGDDDYDDWLKAKVESTARAIIRKQGESDFQGRPRLEQFLTAVLYCVGTRFNAAGDHFPMSDAPIFLDKAHSDHASKFAKIAPFLPPHIHSDLEEVLKLSPERRRELLGSTIGRLRSFFTPVVASLFSNQAPESLDFRRIVENQEIMLVNLRRTRSFSIDQGNAIGGLFINEILETAQIAERMRRMPFFLFIDEASRFIGQDLMDALAQFRKWKLSLCIAAQDLSSLRGKEVDMAPKLLSQCGTQICFQQKFPDDVETFGKLFGIPSLDFTRHMQEVDRPDGYEVIDTHQVAHTEGKRRSESTSDGDGWQYGKNRINDRRSTNSSTGKTSDESYSRTESFGQQYLSKTRVELHDTGKLQMAVMDQMYRKMSDIMNLGRGEAMIFAAGNEPVTLKVKHVREIFPDEERSAVVDLVEKYKLRVFKSHSYNFVRTATPELAATPSDFPKNAPPTTPSPF